MHDGTDASVHHRHLYLERRVMLMLIFLFFPSQALKGMHDGTDASVHHRHLYIARRVMPMLLERQDQLWPETPKPVEQQQQLTEQEGG